MQLENAWRIAALPLAFPLVAALAAAMLFTASFDEAPAASPEACATQAPSLLATPCPSYAERDWIPPLRAPIVSGFRSPGRPGHEGVDLGAPRFTVIRAASAGTVIVAECNAPASHGCDRDGSPSIKGCGWYVEIAHPAGLSTRYCHMVERPMVTVGQPVAAGQPLGKVGSSGNSSGPHLHFETRVDGAAVNPVPLMAARGAPVGANN